MKLVRSHAKLRPLERWLEKAFHGDFKDSREALEEWRLAQRSAGSAGLQGKTAIPAWMAGMLVISAALCVSVTAIWVFYS